MKKEHSERLRPILLKAFEMAIVGGPSFWRIYLGWQDYGSVSWCWSKCPCRMVLSLRVKLLNLWHLRQIRSLVNASKKSSTRIHAIPHFVSSNIIACVAGGIVRVLRKILTVESEYGRRSREENGKEPLWISRLCRENRPFALWRHTR